MTTKTKAILKTVNEGLSDTAEAATDAVESIAHTGSGVFEKARKVAADGYDSVASAVADGANDVAETATGYAKKAVKQAKRVASQVEDEVTSRRKDLRSVARRNPVGTIAVAVGVGVIIGWLLPRSSDS